MELQSHQDLLYCNENKYNFYYYKKEDLDDFGVPYDYNSIMHYSRYTFSKNGRQTIIPRPYHDDELGQRHGFSKLDVEKINRMYQCKKEEITGDIEEELKHRPKPKKILHYHETDDGPAIPIDYLGNRIYGLPNDISGERVANWNPSLGVNPEELGTYAEGDILFSNPTSKSAYASKFFRWRGAKIPYKITGRFKWNRKKFCLPD
ncbi:hypothetical protein PV327_006553 [Microctonus hyperodae]|uniref:Metalloendopeptidase n=1 Tax=Microctonus hyperodae TaxID=165561 RepID=A0AA39KIK2_MICHY|nr:hypothetical protein PV327_006553 [Microctonus hyperodae]